MKKLLLICMVSLIASTTQAGVQDTIQTNVPALKNVFARNFYFGCLLSYNAIGFSTDPYVSGQSAVYDTNGGYLIKYHMNSMGPGNNMKPQYTIDLSGSASAYNAASTQAAKDSINTHPIVRFNGDLIAQLNWAQRQGFKFRGHTLVWYNQTPGTGFFRTGFSSTGGRVSKDTMSLRMDNYIKEVIRLIHQGWPGMLLAIDVVNEAINDGTGTDRSASNEWYTTFGDNSYVAKAFEFARKYTVQYGEAQIHLYYNDYNTHDANKANGIVRLCGPIFHAGNLDGIGMQEHDGTSYPTPAQWRASYAKFDTVCTEMAVTEFDVKPDSTTPGGLAAQANQVGSLVKCFLEKSFRSGRGKIVNLTKDGLNDAHTFNANSSFWTGTDQCKPAFYAAAGVGQNFNALDSMIAYANTLPPGGFTSGTWATLSSALTAANAAMAKDYSSSMSAADTLAQAKTALKAALDGLVTGVNSTADMPAAFALSQNYPNPFNPATVIRYQSPVASRVRLVVYDMLGREVTVLVDDQKAPGSFEVTFDASGLASGVYMYRLIAGDLVQTRRMVLIR
jgi:GH35 family endo-1,4-beta-xylanase